MNKRVHFSVSFRFNTIMYMLETVGGGGGGVYILNKSVPRPLKLCLLKFNISFRHFMDILVTDRIPYQGNNPFSFQLPTGLLVHAPIYCFTYDQIMQVFDKLLIYIHTGATRTRIKLINEARFFTF